MHNMRRKVAFLLAGLMVASSLSITPIVKEEKVSAATQKENVNLIPGGDFEEESDAWGGFGQEGGEATFEQKDGQFVCNIDKVGKCSWAVQASCPTGFALYQNGKYRLSFDISSSVTRNLACGIQLNSGDYRSYVNKGITATDEMTTYTFDFTMKDETDLVPCLFFNLGLYNEEDLDPHTVTIDNVSLELIDGSNIEESGTQKAQEENVNLLPGGGTFDEVSDDWGSMTCEGGDAEIEQKDGKLVCDIKELGDVKWGVQAHCNSGFALYQYGKYRLSFDINSTIARELDYGIQLNSGDYHSYTYGSVVADEETQTVTIEFTMKDETDKAPALFFNMGNYGDALDPHVVTIDNVSLELIDGSKIEATSSSVKKQEENVNLIPGGGTFDEFCDDWGSYTTDGGDATFEQKDGAYVIDIADVGTLNYSVQASCGSGFQLYQNGVYQLSFDISSTVARALEYGIQLNGGDYHAYTQDRINVNDEVQTITVTFTMKDENDKAPALFFNMGTYGDELDAHTVRIDNVDLRLIDGSKIVYDEETETENPINLNQVGYKTDAKKVAVFRGADDLAGKTFTVVNAEDDSVVYEGEIGEGVTNKAAGEVDYSGDFSEVTEPGTYYINVEGLGKSYNFLVSDEAFNDAFKSTFRFFYLQRCQELDEDHAGAFAHPQCHTQLARIYGTEDEYIDVSGGWHDAGDYGRYVVATSVSAADLLMAYSANKAAFSDDMGLPESGNGIADVLDEIRGQIEWLMKMQNKENGGVYHKVTTANFPGTIAADQETGELIVCPITATATGDFAALMGMAYDAFKNVDKAFAEECLAAGEKAYDYLVTMPSKAVVNPKGIVTGEYGDYSDLDERYWAAASLFKATGKDKYNDAVKEAVQVSVKSGYGWQDVGSYGSNLYLKSNGADEETVELIKEAILDKADLLLAVAKEEGYGVSNTIGDYYWGSNMGTLNNATILVDAYNLTGNQEYMDFAKEHVNYMFGKNSVGTSYVTGYGTVTPQNPHHRPSLVYGQTIPGALVGGPNKNLEDPIAKAYLAEKAAAKCYMDSADCYSVNEVDIYWNSALVRALAEMEFVGSTKQEEEQYSDIAMDVALASNLNGNIINQTYTIKADGEDIVDTSKVALRYYLTKSDDKAINYNVDHAAINFNKAPWYQALTSATNIDIAEDEKGAYIELTFDDAVEIEPGAGAMTIQARINNTDWSVFDADTTGELVVYYDGKIVK